MNVHEFLRTRPCLEECEFYLAALRDQIENRHLYPEGFVPQYEEITAEVLGPIETYRARLMSGKEVPAPSRLERAYEYKSKKKPKKRRTLR